MSRLNWVSISYLNKLHLSKIIVEFITFSDALFMMMKSSMDDFKNLNFLALLSQTLNDKLNWDFTVTVSLQCKDLELRNESKGVGE